MELLALITVNLGILNLLPFPALDGGKVVFLVIEGVTGHAVPEKLQSMLTLATFGLLFGLMIFATYNEMCIRDRPTGIPLNEAPVWQRALVMVAGAVMNFVLGFVAVSYTHLFASLEVMPELDNTIQVNIRPEERYTCISISSGLMFT